MEKDSRDYKQEQRLKYSKQLQALKRNIREIRREQGFRSADSLARELGVHLKTVQGWENLDNGLWPDLFEMLRVCDLFGIDMDSLLGRIEEPTHDIKFICEKTGLSAVAVERLISLKGSGFDDLVSEILTHKNAARLLRVMLLASDVAEIEWLDLDTIPRELLSSYSDKPLDFSVGAGSDVADFLASQELINLIRSIREKRENEVKETKVRGYIPARLVRQYDVDGAKKTRRAMLERIEDDCIYWGETAEAAEAEEDPRQAENAEKQLAKLSALSKKIRLASYAEWQRGNLQRQYKSIYREEAKDNGQEPTEST